MQLHEVKRKNLNKTAVQIGRGGKRGKTSGKGTKGQLARAGGRPRPEMRDIIKKIPKKRGLGSHAYGFSVMGKKSVSVYLGELDKKMSNGDIVTPISLLKKGIIKRVKGKIPAVKLLANGSISKKLFIKSCLVSKGAKEAILKAGGDLLSPKIEGKVDGTKSKKTLEKKVKKESSKTEKVAEKSDIK